VSKTIGPWERTSRRPDRRRVTVAEASEILGVTVEAVGGRIKRGTLEHERDSGTVYALIEADQSTTSLPTRRGQSPTRSWPTNCAIVFATSSARWRSERQECGRIRSSPSSCRGSRS
jgi:hypothetical protein